jgi:hypothetical protein
MVDHVQMPADLYDCHSLSVIASAFLRAGVENDEGLFQVRVHVWVCIIYIHTLWTYIHKYMYICMYVC